MKKSIFMILGIMLVIILVLTYGYYNYRTIKLRTEKTNKEFETYTDCNILGSTLMTLINKAIDSNEKNNVLLNNQNVYENNNETSINIEVKFTESDKIFKMESIANAGSEAFIKNYSNMMFKCSKKEYHDKTNNIKYLLFEQI